ncbi:MAG: hypothetical protein WCJ29_03080 [bacterium]
MEKSSTYKFLVPTLAVLLAASIGTNIVQYQQRNAKIQAQKSEKNLAVTAPAPLATPKGSWQLYKEPTTGLGVMYWSKDGEPINLADVSDISIFTTDSFIRPEEPYIVRILDATDANINKAGCAITGDQIFGEVKKTIGDNQYCITAAGEGAAGTMYETKLYTTKHNGKYVSFIFTTSSSLGPADDPLCFDGVQTARCKDHYYGTLFKNNFDELLESQILSTVRWDKIK